MVWFILLVAYTLYAIFDCLATTYRARMHWVVWSRRMPGDAGAILFDRLVCYVGMTWFIHGLLLMIVWCP